MNQVHREFIFPSGQKLQLVQGDITSQKVDAIVNAANAHLAHGAGVADAIVRRGGPQIQIDSNQWVREHGLVTHSEPAFTRAGNLPCRYVIHAVGPVWGEENEEAKLAAAIQGSLRRAEQLGLSSIALPALSTGIFGFPKPLAAQVIFTAIQDHMGDHPGSTLKLICLVLYDQDTLQAFIEAWEKDDHFSA